MWSGEVFPREQPTMADESDGKLACGSSSRMSLLEIVIAIDQGHRGQMAIRMRIPSYVLPSPSWASAPQAPQPCLTQGTPPVSGTQRPFGPPLHRPVVPAPERQTLPGPSLWRFNWTGLLLALPPQPCPHLYDLTCPPRTPAKEEPRATAMWLAPSHTLVSDGACSSSQA